jgi:hypothetical protein
MRNPSIVVVGVALLIVLGVAHESLAQQQPQLQTNRYLGDRWSIRLFGNLTELTSDVAAGRQLGALINLEELLGFDDQVGTWGFDAFFRFSKNKKHLIRVTYQDYSRDAYAALVGTVPILDVEFIGEVSSSFGNKVGSISYQYSFTNSNKTEAGILAGLGFYDYSLALSGRYIVDNDPNLEEFGSRSESILAPVPALGFYVNYAVLPNLIVDLRTSFINLSIDVHEGRIFHTMGNLTWYFTRHFGLGVGLSSSDIVYENTGSDSRIKVDLRQTSITANAAFVF